MFFRTKGYIWYDYFLSKNKYFFVVYISSLFLFLIYLRYLPKQQHVLILLKAIFYEPNQLILLIYIDHKRFGFYRFLIFITIW